MKTNNSTNSSLGENETLDVLKPKKLFIITIAIYGIFSVLIACACFFIEYPVNYSGKFIRLQKTENSNNEIIINLKKDPFVSRNNSVVISNLKGEKYTGNIVKYSELSDKNTLEVSVLIKHHVDNLNLIQNQTIEVTIRQKLILILIKKIN